MSVTNTISSPTFAEISKTAGQGISNRNWQSDLGGTAAAAINYVMQQQQNAWELQLWNKMNEYNSPAEQMKRYQEAGLNPNLIYSQQNTTTTPGSSPPIAAKPTNFKAQNTIAGLDAAGRIMSGLNNVIGQVRDTFDYVNYGMTQHERQNMLLSNNIYNTQQQGDLLNKQNFLQSILTGETSLNQKFQTWDDRVQYTARDIPFIQRYLNENERAAKEIEKVQFYLDHLGPAQEANIEAGTSLRSSQLGWNDNLRQFVDSINTGVPWLDSLLKAIMRIASGRLGVN